MNIVVPNANIANVPYYYNTLSNAIGVTVPTTVANTIKQLLAIDIGFPFRISGRYSQITGP